MCVYVICMYTHMHRHVQTLHTTYNICRHTRLQTHVYVHAHKKTSIIYIYIYIYTCMYVCIYIYIYIYINIYKYMRCACNSMCVYLWLFVCAYCLVNQSGVRKHQHADAHKHERTSVQSMYTIWKSIICRKHNFMHNMDSDNFMR